MSRWCLIYIITIWVLSSSAVDEKQIQRLVGGHIRIYHDSQDTELLTPEASGSKNKKSQKSNEEEKKTLSQQVADGKYGLIQKELFTRPSKRPGVLSYENNSEVPKDTLSNLGGLTKDDIWLAENHLLVIKGGTYPPHDNKHENSASIWPPIDDYKAPLRQVKIPAHPKIPPPFPVQLTDNGPLQILGTNSSRTINGTLEEAGFPILPPEDFDSNSYLPPPPIYSNSPNITSGKTSVPVPAYPSGEYLPGPPFPLHNLNGTLPPFFASLPPGAAILPPPNLTELIDEDDPSIYYPPPYSFYYPKNNSSIVPPGPLVPGIVLPPPPNFFGPLEENTTKKSSVTTRKPGRHRTTTTTPLPQIRPTTTEIAHTSVINDKTTTKPLRTLPVHIPIDINNELKPIVTTSPPNIVTILSVRSKISKNRTIAPRPHKTRPTVTILKPVKSTYEEPNSHVPVNNYSNEYKSKFHPNTISTTKVPLKLYYSTTKDIETNSIKENYNAANTKRIRPTTPKSPARYYYYEEQPAKELTTSKPFYNVPKEYYLPPKQAQQIPAQEQKYIYMPSRPYNTQRPRYRFVQTPKTDTFSIHIARLQKQLSQYYTTSRPTYKSPYSPKPVYQFSFEAVNYRQPQHPEIDDPQDKFRPLPKYSVQIQPAIEIIPGDLPNQQNTPPPKYYQVTTERPVSSKQYQSDIPIYNYQHGNERGNGAATPRPITQFSFEATPNPVYQNYYTKPDEHFFDENTRHYFTTFGKKIQNTTPIPQNYQQVKNVNNYEQQKPISLEGDTSINYLHPRPQINPDSEFVPITTPQQKPNYPQVIRYTPKISPYTQESRQKDQGAHIVKSVDTAEGQGSFISYQLPGDDGAHFYFLTPQLIQSRNQGAGFYYSKDNVSRLRRRRNKER